MFLIVRNGKRRSTRNTSRNSDFNLGEPQDFLHGQRSAASHKVCQGRSEMLAIFPNHDGGHQQDFRLFNSFGNRTDGQSKCLVTFSGPDISTDDAAQDARDDGCHVQKQDNIYGNVNSLTPSSSGSSFSLDPDDLQVDDVGNALYENNSSFLAEGVLAVSPAAAASRDTYAHPNLENENRAQRPSRQIYLCLLFKI